MFFFNDSSFSYFLYSVYSLILYVFLDFSFFNLYIGLYLLFLLLFCFFRFSVSFYLWNAKRYCFLILFLIKLVLFPAALCLGPSVGVLVWKVSLGTYFLFFMFLLFSLFFFLINLNMANISAYLCGNFPRGSNSWGCSVECFLDLPPNATVFLYFSLLNSSFSLLPCASAHLWGFLCGKFPWGPIF